MHIMQEKKGHQRSDVKSGSVYWLNFLFSQEKVECENVRYLFLYNINIPSSYPLRRQRKAYCSEKVREA